MSCLANIVLCAYSDIGDICDLYQIQEELASMVKAQGEMVDNIGKSKHSAFCSASGQLHVAKYC